MTATRSGRVPPRSWSSPWPTAAPGRPRSPPSTRVAPLEVKLGDQVFPSLNTALVGKPADSRIVVASTPDDAYGDSGSPQIGIKGGDSVVMVADILSTDPT